MTSRLAVLALVLLPAGAASGESPLVTARRTLDAGRLDDLFAQLEERVFVDGEQVPAAELLAEASERSLERRDSVLALHFAQLALRTSKKHPRALAAAARTCREQQEFSAAERYADQWIEAAPGSAAARLLRAEIAWDQGEWKRSLAFAKELSETSLAAPERTRLRAIRESSGRELLVRNAPPRRVTELPDMARAKAPAGSAPAGTGPLAVAAKGAVVLYGTTWCGYCSKARAYLRRKGVDFVERDVEKEPGASAELAQKARRSGTVVSGVPVIDVKGTLVLGFDEATLDRLLK
jgi:glutaredoxin